MLTYESHLRVAFLLPPKNSTGAIDSIKTAALLFALSALLTTRSAVRQTSSSICDSSGQQYAGLAAKNGHGLPKRSGESQIELPTEEAMRVDDTVTEQELRQAYTESGIWNLGITFRQALDSAAIYTGLIGCVKSVRKKAQRHRQQHLQPRLI